jgi:predicted nucleotidyltransferase
MIPLKFRDFISRAEAIFKQDSRIAGLALGGSYIKGALDDYSDLDFIVAVEPAHLEAVLNERVPIAEKLGIVLSSFTGEHVGVPSLLICLYDAPLLHVDFNFVTPEQAGKRLQDPVILFEKDGALSDVYAATKPMQLPSRLQWIEDRFWVWVHYIASKIGRGELFDALDSIGYIRENVLGPMIQGGRGYRRGASAS